VDADENPVCGEADITLQRVSAVDGFGISRERVLRYVLGSTLVSDHVNGRGRRDFGWALWSTFVRMCIVRSDAVERQRRISRWPASPTAGGSAARPAVASEAAARYPVQSAVGSVPT